MPKGWNNDALGLVFKSSEVKLFTTWHTYGMKLSQLWKQSGVVRIMTYSLPDIDYVRTQLGRRSHNIMLIGHSKFHDKAVALRMTFPGIDVRLTDTMHSKVLAIEPRTLYIGSANFGNSGWHETMIGVRSKEAHDYFVSEIWNCEWSRAASV